MNSIEEQRKTPKSIPIELWTRIFHVHPHSISETRIFIGEKLILEKSRSRHLFYFYFKGKIKQERKTLKCDSIIFGKNMSLKNPSLGSGIRLPIGKVPLKEAPL